jgi:hypothetical protein
MEENVEEKKVSVEDILKKYPKNVKEVDVNLLVANEWNPNTQTPIIYESLKKSIQRYGWLQFPVVREYVGQYQIIDGFHRGKAAKDLGMEKVTVLVLGDETTEVSDADAMLLTQLLNTRGQDDILKRAELLKKMKEKAKDGEDLFGYLPMAIKEIESQLDLLNFDFSKFMETATDVDVAEGAKALKLVTDLERELRKLHANSKSTNFRLLLEQYFEWAKVMISNLEVT